MTRDKEQLTVTLTGADWDRIISAADCGLADLDPEAKNKVWNALERLEDAIKAARSELDA